jgi:prepilin-type N-terminal cleavage/methylation domain-containing protein
VSVPKRGDGFTLIELLIVVAIIGILAAIAIPNFLEAQTRAKVARVESDERTLGMALEMYYLEYNDYPPKSAWGSHTNAAYFNALSTPIAFISCADCVDDPFQYEPDHDSMEGLRYGYYQPYKVPWKFMVYPFYRGTMINPARYLWWIVSRGPDRAMNADPNDTTAVPLGQYYPYDPSNGTVSDGDINRMGPY